MIMMMGIGTPSSQSSIPRPMSASFFDSGLIVSPNKRANIHFVPAKHTAPNEHLAHLSGQFLILEGKDDTLIPQSARARLREAAPAPKTVIAFGGDHMGVGSNKMSLLQAIIAASTTWLIEKGAVNPI